MCIVRHLGLCVLLDMLMMCVMLDVAYYMSGSYRIHPSACTMWLLCVHNFELGKLGTVKLLDQNYASYLIAMVVRS